jgi:hypothetical protein
MFFGMTPLDILVLLSAAVLAGALNAVAGGGSFFTFPALVFTGVSPIAANATNAVVVWPGSIASTGAYREEVRKTQPRVVVALSVASLVGGLLGAWLLLAFRQYEETFNDIVPWLLLVATLLFAFGGNLTKWTKEHIELSETSALSVSIVTGLQLLIAIYGGFFGGGMGVLMLSAYALLGMENIHIMNALKSLASVLIKGIAVLAFIFSGLVVWPEAILMIVGASVGGYAGAHYARRLDSRLVKRFVIVAGFAITIAFFVSG